MKWTTPVLKRVDALVGGVVAASLPPARPGAIREPRRILVIRPGGIGDAVLLVPALRALKERFPQARLTVLAEHRNASAFDLCGAVDHLLRYDDPWQLLRALRGGYDLVIDTEQWHRLSAVIARLAGAPFSVGFASNGRARLFTHQVAYSHDRYEACSFLDLLSPLGMAAPGELAVPFLSVPGPAAARAAELVAPLRGRRFQVIFPGASIAERRWGAERYRAVARRVAAQGVPAVVVGGKDDAGEGAAIVRGLDGMNLAGQTTLAETAALLAGAALLVSGDSGVLHLAVGLGVPVVSLFGPGIQEKWGPRGARDAVLNRRLSCSPCTRFGTTPPCPFGSRCMTGIEVDEVVAAVIASLGA